MRLSSLPGVDLLVILLLMNFNQIIRLAE